MRYIMRMDTGSTGCYSAIQSWNSNNLPNGYVWFPESLMNKFYAPGKKCAGFVTPTLNEAGDTVVDLEWNDEAYNAYLSTLPKWYVNGVPNKINEMSKACQEAIINGVDVTLKEATETEEAVVKHYDYTLEDQSNLSNIFNSLVMGGITTGYPYHAKGEACMMYSTEDLLKIVIAQNTNSTYHQTYFNQMKSYLNTFVGADDDKEEEFNSITYGQELPEEYMNKITELVNEANAQMATLIEKIKLQMASNAVNTGSDSNTIDKNDTNSDTSNDGTFTITDTVMGNITEDVKS